MLQTAVSIPHPSMIKRPNLFLVPGHPGICCVCDKETQAGIQVHERSNWPKSQREALIYIPPADLAWILEVFTNSLACISREDERIRCEHPRWLCRKFHVCKKSQKLREDLLYTVIRLD